jgi:hypothetical protein
MSTATMRREATRLRGRLGGDSCGPGCPPVRVVSTGSPWGAEGTAPPCPRCGREARIVRLEYDPDFYGNAGRPGVG